MNLITVRCWRPQDQVEDEHRLAFVIALTPYEAEVLCRAAYENAGYSRFQAHEVVEGYFDGPAREIGYAGQAPSFSWKR